MQIRTVDFSKYSSIKAGSVQEVTVLEKGDTPPDGAFIIGGANNLLVTNNPPVLVMLGKDFDYIELTNEYLEIGCATKTGRVLSFTKKNNIANLEFVAKLPGTIGGMVAMNAGVKSYEIFNYITEVEINGKWISKESIDHGYRFAKLNGIATRVRIDLEYGFSEELKDELIELRANQPKEPSAGSAFKNPKGDYAARLIEEVGLKGYQIGGMAISSVHSNFLVNLGGGTYKEALELLALAKNRVYEKFKVKLEEEICVI